MALRDGKKEFGGFSVDPSRMTRMTREALQDGLDVFKRLRGDTRVPAQTAVALASALAHAAAEVTSKRGNEAAIEFMRVFRGAFFMVLRDARSGLILPFGMMPGPAPGVSEIFGG